MLYWYIVMSFILIVLINAYVIAIEVLSRYNLCGYVKESKMGNSLLYIYMLISTVTLLPGVNILTVVLLVYDYLTEEK